MKKIIILQFIVLLMGTIFAWGNFIIELIVWLNKVDCPTDCAAGAGVINPFLTPCFFGAVFFTTAFVLSSILFLKNKKNNNIMLK